MGVVGLPRPWRPVQMGCARGLGRPCTAVAASTGRPWASYSPRTDTNNCRYIKDTIGRLATQVDPSWFVTGCGEHVLKAGVQADWTTNDADRGQKANVVAFAWNRALLGTRGKYGCYRPTPNNQEPHRGQIFRSRAEGRTAGLFIQDDWTISHRVTVNAGLRTEHDTVPRYSVTGGDSLNGVRGRMIGSFNTVCRAEFTKRSVSDGPRPGARRVQSARTGNMWPPRIAATSNSERMKRLRRRDVVQTSRKGICRATAGRKRTRAWRASQ